MATDAEKVIEKPSMNSPSGGKDAEPKTDSETSPATMPLEQEKVNVPPDGGYGWVCVACVALINAHTWGVNSSYGVFLAHYVASDTFPGATDLQYAFVGGLSISLALLTAPVATICTRKFGTQITLGIGIILEFVGLLCASWASQIWQLFLTQGAAFGFGMGFLFVGSVGVVPQWFTRKRSFANSIAAGGSGLGGLIYSLATNAIIESLGLGWAFRILAIVALVVNTICTILIRDRNKAIGSIQLAFDVQLFKRVEYWGTLWWGFFSLLGYVILLFSLPSYASSVGLTAQQGSVAGAVLNLGQGLGRPFIGYFSDTFGRINMAGTCTFLASLFCFVIWIFAKSYGVLIFFAFIVGGVAGTFWTTVGPVSAEVVGLQALPSALAIMWLFQVLPCTFAEPIGLQLRAATGDIFLHAQVFTGCMYLFGTICIWMVRAWKIWKIRQNKEKSELAKSHIDSAPRLEMSDGERGVSQSTIKEKLRGLWAWQRV